MSELLELHSIGLPESAAMLCLIFASGFFSSSETAIFYLSHDELRRFRIGKPRERVVAALLSDADRLLTAILFWNLLINLSFFSVSVVVTRRLGQAGYPTAAGLFGMTSLLAIILFGEVLPKSIAVAFRQSLAVLVSWPLALAVRLVDPLAPFFRRVTWIIRTMFWPKIAFEPHLEAEDLDRAIDATEMSAEIVRQERQVLHNILDLSEMTAEEVMRPRGSYGILPRPVNLDQLQGMTRSADYVLIQEENSDEVEAAVALASFATMPDQHLDAAAEEVVHVPWCANLAYILQLMRERFCNIAVIVNEYGDVIGIVTYEDIIDTFLDPQPSRAKRVLQREPVLEVAPGKYHVDGITTLRYLCMRLNIDYDPDSESLVTLSGMLQEEFEQIPQIDDECTWRGFRIKVIEVAKRGKLRAMVSREDEPDHQVSKLTN